MTKIIVREPLQTSRCERSEMILSEEKPNNCDLPGLLVRLGRKLFVHKHAVGWLTMAEVAMFCRRYRLRWNGGSIGARHLESCAHSYFEKNAEIYGEDVNVQMKTEDVPDSYRETMYLRFRKINPDGTCAWEAP